MFSYVVDACAAATILLSVVGNVMEVHQSLTFEQSAEGNILRAQVIAGRSPNTIMAIKSRRMKWAGDVAWFDG